jgi:DNA-binding Xre family transcriptional regulator
MVKVDYKKLWLMLVERNLTKAQLRKSASLSSATLTKLNKNEFVSMDVLAKICDALDCNLGDIADMVRGK